MTQPQLAARLFAWGGAVVFFLSLAYFLFAFLVIYGVPEASVASGLSRTRHSITWNVILFTLFATHHSVFARDRARRWIAQTLPAGLERSVYVWIAGLLFIAVCALWRPLPGVAWRADGAVLWALRFVQLGGIGLSLCSAAILDIHELAGISFRRPQGLRLPGDTDADMVAGSLQASGSRGQASRTEFKARGPYGWVRHPIYAGWFLLVWAASPMTMTRLVFAIVSCGYLLVAIPLEERSLRAGSDGAYDRYKGQVRWKLVPGIY